MQRRRCAARGRRYAVHGSERGGADVLKEVLSKAALGDKDAALRVARIYQSGLNGTPRDELKTIEWLRRASELGNAEASYALSRYHWARDELREQVRYENRSYEQGRGTAAIPSQEPEAVRALADAYVASMEPEVPVRRPDPRSRYVSSFFSGYTQLDGSIITTDKVSAAGYHAGQAYRRDHPGTLSEIMHGFGYVWVEAEGTLGIDREYSGLALRYTREVWWFDPMRGPGADEGSLTRPLKRGPMRVVGFLSPRGRYGHRSAFRHQFLAMSIMPVSE